MQCNRDECKVKLLEAKKFVFFFFLNEPAPTEIYTLPLHDAVPIYFPFIADRGLWPFRADVAHFDQLPGRRASLLLSARAYQRPEYAALWKTLSPDPAAPDVLRTLPIHQPLLWVRQPPRA